MACSDGFDPAKFVVENLIDELDPYQDNAITQAVLSHPHADHIAQCGELGLDKPLYPALLTCPHDKDYKDGTPSNDKVNWDRIKNPSGTENLIDVYRELYSGDSRGLPLQTILFDSKRTARYLEYAIYYVRPPVCEDLHESDDNKYGNATSIMFYLRHGSQTILFPGDMTPEGMEHVLDEGNGVEKRYTKFNKQAAQDHPTWHRETSDQPSLRSLLGTHGLSILVAPHHGLESCYSEDLYAAIKGGKPKLVVISERRHKKTDGKVDRRYQSKDGAFGLNVGIDGTKKTQYSLSTVNGHHILIVMSGTGQPKVYADRDAENLLQVLEE